MIRRAVTFAFLGLALTALETSVLAALGAPSASVHLALGLVIWLASEGGAVDGVVAAALVGHAWDVFAGTPPGLGAFLAVAVFVVVRAATQALELGGLLLFVVGGAAETGWLLGAMGLLALTGHDVGDGVGPAVGRLAGQTVAAALLVPFVYRLADRVDRLTGASRDDAREVWLR